MSENQTTGHSRAAAIVAVAATYFYFLLFAEFALLELARPFARNQAGLLPLLAVLGVFGIAGSLAGAAWFCSEKAKGQLAWLFRLAALGSALAAVAPNLSLFLPGCAIAGFSLGGLTVVLSASLRGATGPRRLGLCVALGTGLAYAACNVPMLFVAAPAVQAGIATGVALVASFALDRFSTVRTKTTGTEPGWRCESAWTVALFALVGLDSAAFYIIQHAPSLQAVTWSGSSVLWGNAGMHLGAAVLAGWLFDRGWRARLLLSAGLLLGVACLALTGPTGGSAPRLLYTAGVSLYSVVLVAYPAWEGRPWLSARLFSFAGWIGSGLGIGAALHFSRISPTGIGLAGLLLVGAVLFRQRTLAGCLTLLAFWFAASPPASGADDAAAWRGREVYVAEGCINCHSQYVRPNSASDVERWGPAIPLAESLDTIPPLLGNRRQGPDLSNVGLRRSPDWNRLHLSEPRAVSPGSVMPAYAYLFSPGDSRGPDLVAYLASLGAERAEARAGFVAQWRPNATAATNPTGDPYLFTRLCSACHGPDGRGDGPLSDRLQPAPPDWSHGPRYLPPAGTEGALFLARLIKFGLPGTAMAGHEYLDDAAILRLAHQVQAFQTSAASGPHS